MDNSTFNKLKMACKLILNAIGEDVTREGLVGTPDRFARMWRDFIEYEPGKIDTTFKSNVDQMIIAKDIKVWSFCEHHLLPFVSVISIAYISNGKVIGASKLARIAQKHAHKVNIQENMIAGIHDEVKKITGSKSVGIIARGVHLCMIMRGVKAEGSEFITNRLSGIFKDDTAARSELMSLATSDRIHW